MRSRTRLSARVAAEAVAFLVYVAAGGSALTHVLSGALAVTTPPQPIQSRPTFVAPVDIGIEVVDVDCDGYCQGSFTVLCTTTRDRVGSDWLMVKASDFGPVYEDLGCEARAEWPTNAEGFLP